MPYSIALRSRTDATITGWYDGSDGRLSTDHNRRKVSDKKAMPDRYATSCAASARAMPR